MRIGSLFSGIGGLELGLERGIPGAHAVWQVEIDDFCRAVLSKHWPHVQRFKDVREVGAYNLPVVDLVCGGFPCQDVSSAGKRKGLSGAKSGLWFEYLRIVSELRPRFVVVENVASGKKLWLPQVKEGLGALGYRTRAFALSAFDVGAPHLRRRRCSLLPTPTASSYGTNQGGANGRVGPLRMSLSTMAANGLLATPTATANQLSPSMSKHPGCRTWQAIHPTGALRPSFVEWLMGFPDGWTDLER